MNFNNFIMLDKDRYGFKDMDGLWKYDLYTDGFVKWHEETGEVDNVELGFLVRSRGNCVPGSEMRIYPIVVDRKGECIEYMRREVSEYMSKKVMDFADNSVSCDELGWHILTQYCPEVGMHKIFRNEIFVIGEMYGNKRLRGDDAVEVNSLFNSFFPVKGLIDSSKKNINHLRDEIETARRQIFNIKEEIERKSLACAEALNILENDYNIRNVDELLEEECPEDTALFSLVNSVKVGYAAIDEGGYLNKEVKRLNGLVNELFGLIDKNETFYRNCFNEAIVYSEKLKKYGYKVKLEVEA